MPSLKGIEQKSIYADRVSVSVKQHGTNKTLLEDISVQIPAAHFVTIIGASGCGKSTLLRALAGMNRVSHGGTWLAGHPVQTLRRQFPLAIGYLSQRVAGLNLEP
jgi:sulfonate transport system ATP-binding protein